MNNLNYDPKSLHSHFLPYFGFIAVIFAAIILAYLVAIDPPSAVKNLMFIHEEFVIFRLFSGTWSLCDSKLLIYVEQSFFNNPSAKRNAIRVCSEIADRFCKGEHRRLSG